MQRGVLTINKEDLLHFSSVLRIENFLNTPLHQKLSSAKESKNSEIEILLSEEELETLLDEVGSPIYADTRINNVIQKINELLLSLRNKTPLNM